MQTIEVSRISVSDAERILALIWHQLTKYDLATPKLSIKSYPNGQIDMRLAFGRREAAERVQAVLQMADERAQSAVQ